MKTVADYPNLRAECYWAKNGDLSPEEVRHGSELRVWWKCAAGDDHQWQAGVFSRARKGAGCPFCGGARPSSKHSLAECFPSLAAEWDLERNKGRTPQDVLPGAKSKVWWRCSRHGEHGWQAEVYSRTIGQGCPFCCGKRVGVTNNLTVVAPELAAEWHPTRNGSLTPLDVTRKSARTVWWRCAADPSHEWQVSVAHRTGCPQCPRLKNGTAPLLTLGAPLLTAQWHPGLNGSLTVEGITVYSNRRVWWQCPQHQEHAWQATVQNRVRRNGSDGGGCPFCEGRRVSQANSLAAVYPELALEWHERNPVRPDQVLANYSKPVWWKCSRGPDHEWETLCYLRTKHGAGCPFCKRGRVSVTNSLAALQPELAKEWHPNKNGITSPHDVVATTRRKSWWQCEQGHNWRASPQMRVRGTGCPKCAKIGASERARRTYLSDITVADYPHLVAQWDNKRNGLLLPSHVSHRSNLKVHWRCAIAADHTWQALVSNRTGKGVGCPFCGGLRPSSTNNLALMYPKVARRWHPTKNVSPLPPHEILPHRRQDYWWLCISGHSYLAKAASLLLHNWCPYCEPRKRRVATTRRVRARVSLPSAP
jgi:Probable Zinc-ribbon domain